MGAVGNGSAEVVVSRPPPFLSPPSLLLLPPSLLLPPLSSSKNGFTSARIGTTASQIHGSPSARPTARPREPALFRPNDDTPLLLPTSLEFVANVPQPREHGGGEVHNRIVALPLRGFFESILPQIITWLK